MISGLVASSGTRKITWLCSERSVAFSVITGERMMSYICAASASSRPRDDAKAAHFRRASSCCDRLAGQHQRVAAQDVVDVGALLRQHVDPRHVARGAREILVERRRRR